MDRLIINIIIITLTTVYVLDISGFGYTIQKALFKWRYPDKTYMGQSVKPFGCSLCMTFWLVLIYSMLTMPFFNAIIISVTASYLTIPTKLIWKKITNVINKLN